MKSFFLCRECGNIVPTEQTRGHYDTHAAGCMELFDKDTTDRAFEFSKSKFTVLRNVDFKLIKDDL